MSVGETQLTPGRPRPHPGRTPHLVHDSAEPPVAEPTVCVGLARPKSNNEYI